MQPYRPVSAQHVKSVVVIIFRHSTGPVKWRGLRGTAHNLIWAACHGLGAGHEPHFHEGLARPSPVLTSTEDPQQHPPVRLSIRLSLCWQTHLSVHLPTGTVSACLIRAGAPFLQVLSAPTQPEMARQPSGT